MTLPLALIALLWLLTIGLLFWQGRSRPRWRVWAIDVSAAGALLALVLAFFWRTLSGDVYQPADGGDLASFLYPTWRFAARELAAGHLPLWNPTLYGGSSFINDIQAGFLYLPNLMLFWLAPEFPYTALQWMAALHLWWAGMGVYVLVRSLRLGGETIHPLAAFFGAVVFAFCDPLLLHFGNLNLIAVLAWLPWVMVAFDRALRSRSLAWMALAGLLFALGSYAGHAQSTLLIGLALTVYAIAYAAFDREGAWLSRWLWNLGLLAGAGIVGGLLLAPILLPALEGVRQSVRTDFTYQESVAFSLAPAQMVGLLSPGFFGRGPALHWSLWERVELPYLGVPALIMAIAAIWLRDGARRRSLYPWLVLSLFGLLVALGIYGILHGVLTFLVPFFDQLRAPARALILFALAGSVLAAAGLDVTMRAVARHGGFMNFLKWGSILLVGVFVPLLLVALIVTQETDDLYLRASLALLAMALAAGSWFVTWLLVAGRASGRLSAVLYGVLMTLLLFLELAAAGAYTDISSDDPTLKFSHPDIAAFLAADPEIFRIDTRTGIDHLWQPDTAALLGFEDVGGIANPLESAAWRAYWESTGGRGTAAYHLLNVKYLIARDGTPVPTAWSLALDAPGELSVWRNDVFTPRAWFVKEGGDPRDADASGVPVAVTRPNAQSLNFALDTPSAGTLVVSDHWDDGWRATVNGQTVDVSGSEDGIFTHIPVGAGTVAATLVYTSTRLTQGIWLAVAGIVLILLVLVIERFARRAELS